MPQKSTYNLYVLTKFVEFVWLCIGTGVVMASTLWYVQRIEDDKYYLYYNGYNIEEDDKSKALAIASAVLVVVNLLYNQLLINLRFRCKMSCVTIGLVFYDCINCLQCFACLKYCCIDRYIGNKFGCFKAIATLGLCIVTITDIAEKRKRWEWEVDEEDKF